MGKAAMPKPELKISTATKEQGQAYVATPAGALMLTEDSLSTCFANDYEGLLIFAHLLKRWFIYDPETGLWSHDSMERVMHWIRGFVRNLNADQQAKWAKATIVSAVETFCRRDPRLARSGDEFDATPWLLGTPTGVIDLRSGSELPRLPDHYVSKRTSVSVSSTSSKPKLWLKFLDQATAGDSELVNYLQRLSGYCLTGETREEVLVFMHGSGGNGKGVFMNVLREILGEYARQAPMQIFLANNGDRHPTELAALFGARLVLASESPEGRRWDEERIKSLTGRDAIAARFMNRDFFEFIPRFKLLVASNHKPRIKTVDAAWRRRLHLVPFTCKPEKPDPELKDKLRSEYPAILQWMIEGAEWWMREGLSPPPTITDATEEYFREEDVIGLWFAEKCDEVEGSFYAERKDLYQSYENWCRGMGHAAATMHTMTRWFTANEYEQHPTSKTRPIRGVKLK
jgi:putative DNA primase/helicase